jgi:hypothetical protein
MSHLSYNKSRTNQKVLKNDYSVTDIIFTVRYQVVVNFDNRGVHPK